MDTGLKMKERVVKLSQQGHNQRAIANILGMKQPTVFRILKKFNTTGSMANERKCSCGRNRALSHRDTRQLTRESITHPHYTAVIPYIR